MEQIIILKIWLLLILLGLSAFFSSCETSLFALTKLTLEKIRRHSRESYRRIDKLLSQPRRTLITILLGNEVVNISFSVIFASLFYRYLGSMGDSALAPLVPVIFSWPILLIFGEVVPKTVSIRTPERMARLNAPALDIFSTVVFPLRSLVKYVTDIFARPFLGKAGKQDTIIDEDFFRTFVEMGTEEGTIDSDEKLLIERVFVLDDITVEQVMTPAEKIASISEGATYAKLVDFIKSQRYSRIPVHSRDSRETIIGILNIKDLVGFKYNPEKDFAEFLKAKLKNPVMIPSGTKVLDLLKDFQLRKIHMGIVTDELSRLKGLVTLEDILEELFGEIRDEYDMDEGLVERSEDGRWLVDIKLSFVRFSEMLNYTPQKGGYRTLGQFLTELFGAKLKPGDETVVEGYRIKLIEAKGRLHASITPEEKNLG